MYIGNAKIQGLEADLKMKGSDYNISLFVFFIPYILFEVPSNIIIKRVAPSTWLSSIMVLWGIATIGQGLVKNFGGLVAMRFLVGLFEAGFFPGNYMVCQWNFENSADQKQAVFTSLACTTSVMNSNGVSRSSLAPVSLPARLEDYSLMESHTWTALQDTKLGDGKIPAYFLKPQLIQF
jgi:hypothetical protein